MDSLAKTRALAESAHSLRTLTDGLSFPEGPVELDSNSIAVVELASGQIRRVYQDGSKEVLAKTGGGPNGAALGPDGALYICNNGGFAHHASGDLILPGLLHDDTNQPADYQGGWIERVNVHTGSVDILYESCEGSRLRSPNDLVFDREGGFWFTDSGKHRRRDRDRGGVFYALPDGSRIEEVLAPIDGPNGIGISPDGRRLYVAETPTARLRMWQIESPGMVNTTGLERPNVGRLLVGLGGEQRFDSLAVDSQGNVIVGTLLSGALTVVAPNGEVLAQIETGDPYPTNLCFGGADSRTAYVTLSARGAIATMRWPWPGLKPHWN